MVIQDVPATRGIALFGEVLLVGVLVGVASLPVVTTLAAAGAGAVLVDELVHDQRTPTLRRFLALLAVSLREPVVWMAPALLLAVGGLDALALAAGLPGGRLVGPVVLALLVFGLLCGIRGAARWRPDQSWRAALGAAPLVVLRDWKGSGLLLGGLVVLGAVVAGLPAFWLVVPGLLTLAAVAVEQRPKRR
ncbi:MAG TPA: hypothetical protein VJ914_07590 [Pseudonocardiaceae bacterium]|nr:hypothetical protein [Pseudonocardiaceae bacterium]